MYSEYMLCVAFLRNLLGFTYKFTNQFVIELESVRMRSTDSQDSAKLRIA